MLEAPPDTKKMYVLVNKSKLTLQQCAVQACHSVSEYMGLYGNEENTNDWCFNKEHRTMILCEATEDQMVKMMKIYDLLGKNYRTFREPDLNDLLTAVAFEPIFASEGARLFKKFKLI